MGRRAAKRIRANLTVQVWGTDRNGNRFNLIGQTVDVSRSGARLTGIRTDLAPKASITVQCRGQKAEFQVVWLGVQGDRRDGQVGLRCVELEGRLWPVDIPADEPDRYEAPKPPARSYETRKQDERRKHTRFPVKGNATVLTFMGMQSHEVKLGDISLGGCFLETERMLEIGQRVKLQLKIGTAAFEGSGLVRVCVPKQGMGIEFTQMEERDAKSLRELIRYLDEIEGTLGNIGPADEKAAGA